MRRVCPAENGIRNPSGAVLGMPCTQYVQKLWYLRCSPSVMTGEPVASKRWRVADRAFIAWFKAGVVATARRDGVDEARGPWNAADGLGGYRHGRSSPAKDPDRANLNSAMGTRRYPDASRLHLSSGIFRQP